MVFDYYIVSPLILNPVSMKPSLWSWSSDLFSSGCSVINLITLE